jgi:Fe-S cluster biogenesis protein NfuA
VTINRTDMTDTSAYAELLQRVDAALDDVRPHLAVDGGDVELIDITADKIVRIKWKGACEHCSMSIMTLRAGIEQALMGKIPEIVGVEAINGV